MKYSIYPNTSIAGIPAETSEIHLVRPLSLGMLKKIASKSELKKISMSSSCSSRLSKKARAFLKGKGIETEVHGEQGRAIGIPLPKMRQAIEMRSDFRSLREIEETTGIPKSTVHYLQRYSQRKKVKNGKMVIYLK